MFVTAASSGIGFVVLRARGQALAVMVDQVFRVEHRAR
jgi:hypothetical protein